MTYSYTAQIANSKLGTFALLLFRWRASIYKLLYRELIIYLILYYGINFVYRFALNETQRRGFEEVAIYCGTYSDFVPLTFVLGFYVSWVVNRWWSVFCAICWPDRLAIHVAALVNGNDERGRLIRRTLVRWLNLAQVLTLRNVSVPVKLRFMTLDSVRQAGFLTDSEYEYYAKLFALPETRLSDLNNSSSGKFDSNDSDSTAGNSNFPLAGDSNYVDAPGSNSTAPNSNLKKAPKPPNSKKVLSQKEETIMKRWDSISTSPNGRVKKDSIAAGAHHEGSGYQKPIRQRYARGLENDLVWLLPLQWFGTLASKAHKENRIISDLALTQIISALCDYRDSLMALKVYDWISIPLVYTQVATLAVYSYFLPSLMSRQYLDPSKKYAGHEIDLYVPIFLILEFLFYVGWLKVAESLIYPLGSQDDHFEINWIIDRNAAIGYVFADVEYDSVPPLVKDHHFNEREVFLPHTLASIGNHDAAPVGSAAQVQPSRKLTNPMGSGMAADGSAAMAGPPPPSVMRRLSAAFTSPIDTLINRKRSTAINQPPLEEATTTLPKNPAFLEAGQRQKSTGDGSVSGASFVSDLINNLVDHDHDQLQHQSSISTAGKSAPSKFPQTSLQTIYEKNVKSGGRLTKVSGGSSISEISLDRSGGGIGGGYANSGYVRDEEEEEEETGGYMEDDEGEGDEEQSDRGGEEVITRL